VQVAGGSLGWGGFLLYGRFTLLATTGGGATSEEEPLALGWDIGAPDSFSAFAESAKKKEGVVMCAGIAYGMMYWTIFVSPCDGRYR
jgi:hypothetical protein